MMCHLLDEFTVNVNVIMRAGMFYRYIIFLEFIYSAL